MALPAWYETSSTLRYTPKELRDFKKAMDAIMQERNRIQCVCHHWKKVAMGVEQCKNCGAVRRARQ